MRIPYFSRIRAIKSAILLGLALFSSGCGHRREKPELAYSQNGVLYLTTGSGQLVRSLRTSPPICDFGLSPDGESAVFNSMSRHHYGSALYLLKVSSGAVVRLTPPGGLEVYGDPAFSPDGRAVAMAVHGQASGDLVEGSGPLAIMALDTREISILKATLGSRGEPLGFVNEPEWSPDGTRLVVNFELGFSQVNAKGNSLQDVASMIGCDGCEYMNAVGWLGSKCVVYQAGKNYEEALKTPARVLNLVARTTKPANEVLGVPASSLTDVLKFSPALWVRRAGPKLVVEGGGSAWELPLAPEADVFVSIMPRGDQSRVPEVCR